MKIKGAMTIGVGALVGTGTVVASVLAAYFTRLNATNEKISTVRSDVMAEISLDRQNVAGIQEAVNTLKATVDKQNDLLVQILRAVK